MSNHKITAQGTGVTTEISAGRHTFIIDEHANMGGKDSGPSPLEYLLGSLAGCEEVIAQLVAREKGIKLNGIRFEVEGTLDNKGLMGDPNVKPYFEKVRVRAIVDTPEDESRVKELQEAVDRRCPVFTLIKAAGVELDAVWTKQ
jgi:putative redox protein